MTEPARPVGVLVDHLVDCTKPDAFLIANHRAADAIVDLLLVDGWTLVNTEIVAGKRIRSLKPPATI